MQMVSRNAEARLVEALGEIEEQRDSWTVIFFNLQRLLEQYRNEYQLKIATNLASDMLSELEGGIYSFRDGSMAVMGRHLNSVQMNKLIFQLRYLYMDDPLAYSESGSENQDFCTVFRLFTDWQACQDFASRRMMKLSREHNEEAGGAPGKTAGESGGNKPALPSQFSAAGMAGIEKNLVMLGLSSALRRQSICAIRADEKPTRVFDELYINMAHLRQLLRVDYDMLSNRGLFRYLTQLLDGRVLDLVQTMPEQYLTSPISININVETLLSGRFQEFDASLSDKQKVAIVFEVPIADVFADMSAYLYARDYMQGRGYRMCIDGITKRSILHLDRQRLKADLIKLQWDADLASELSTPENQELMEAVNQCGSKRIILCRCDNAEAIEYGHAMNISLFQGRYIDSKINPNAKVSN